MKNLQNDNEKRRQKSERLEICCAKYEFDYNALAQYSRRNTVILGDIPNSVLDDILEESVISVLAAKPEATKACHRFGKANRKISKIALL